MADQLQLVTADGNDPVSPTRAKVIAKEQPKIKSEETTIVQGIVGFMCGLVAGGVLYFVLWFFYSLDEMLALYIIGPITFLMAMGMSLSVHCRCVILLMVPNLSTGKGRAAIFSLIFAMMLIGPINNISDNAAEISLSMSCSADMARNQTQSLKQQLQDPINQIKEKTEEMAETLQGINDALSSAFQPISSALNSFVQGLEDVANALDQASQACKKMFNSAYSSCYSGINTAYSDCKSALQNFRRRRDLTDTQKMKFEEAILRKVWHKLHERKQNMLKWRAERLNENFMEASKNGYGRFFNMSELDELLNEYDVGSNMSYDHAIRNKRGISAICEVLNVGSVCDVLKVGNVLCSPVSSADDLIVAAAKGLKELYDEIKNFFLFEINKAFQLLGLADAEQIAENIITTIESELTINTTIVLTGFTYIGNLLALSLILLFTKSFNYMRKYLSDDDYNNIYITKQFKNYDEECKSLGEPTVLPLRKPERKVYVDTRWIRLGPTEAKSCLTGMIQLILHMMICAVIIFFNYVFYYIVYLVQKYGSVDITVEGSSTIVFEIAGSGTVAKFLRSLVEGINIHSSFNTDFNITKCLPDAHEPSSSDIPQFLAMYVLALIFILLQAYGMRLRHKIMASFYPRQELERTIFLHKKILHNRKSKNSFLHQHVKTMKKEAEYVTHESVAHIIANKIPVIKTAVKGKPTCLSCKATEKKGQQFYQCPNRFCEAVYCPHCFDDMGKSCILCRNATLMAEALQIHDHIVHE